MGDDDVVTWTDDLVTYRATVDFAEMPILYFMAICLTDVSNVEDRVEKLKRITSSVKAENLGWFYGCWRTSTQQRRLDESKNNADS
jgi:hypothetical protein